MYTRPSYHNESVSIGATAVQPIRRNPYRFGPDLKCIKAFQVCGRVSLAQQEKGISQA